MRLCFRSFIEYNIFLNEANRTILQSAFNCHLLFARTTTTVVMPEMSCPSLLITAQKQIKLILNTVY